MFRSCKYPEPVITPMNDICHIGPKGLELIKKYEGYRGVAYRCPAGVWTVGYGHTNGVTKATTCNEAQAEAWLLEDVAFAEAAVTEAAIPALNQNQFDALVSFVFNVGSGNFRRSTLLRIAKVDSRDARIEKEFMRWNKAKVDGVLVPLPGLTQRRKEEAQLYFSR